MSNTDLSNAAPEVALILAAGLGSRLRPQTKTPKPLTWVLGLTLAERVCGEFQFMRRWVSENGRCSVIATKSF